MPLPIITEGKYCKFCFKDGEFTFRGTFEEYIQKQINLAEEMGLHRDEAEKDIRERIPNLERWQQP